MEPKAATLSHAAGGSSSRARRKNSASLGFEPGQLRARAHARARVVFACCVWVWVWVRGGALNEVPAKMLGATAGGE